MTVKQKVKILLCCLLLTTYFQPPLAFAKSGVAAYQFSLNALDGSKVELASLRGKVVFLDFWASWCPPCRASISAVSKLYEKYKDNKDVVIIGVNMENIQTAKKFVSEKKIKYLNVIGDDNTSRSYQIRGIPTFVLINKKGFIVGKWVGFSEQLYDEWTAKIDEVLAEVIEPPAPLKATPKKRKKSK